MVNDDTFSQTSKTASIPRPHYIPTPFSQFSNYQINYTPLSPQFSCGLGKFNHRFFDFSASSVTNLDFLSTITVKQDTCFPLILQDSILSASKCPNSSLLFTVSGLSEISVLLGIFLPVPCLLGRMVFFDILPCFLLNRYLYSPLEEE